LPDSVGQCDHINVLLHVVGESVAHNRHMTGSVIELFFLHTVPRSL